MSFASQESKIPLGSLIQPRLYRSRHKETVAQIVLQHTAVPPSDGAWIGREPQGGASDREEARLTAGTTASGPSGEVGDLADQLGFA